MSQPRSLFVSEPKFDILYKIENVKLKEFYSTLLKYEVFDEVNSSKIKVVPLLKAVKHNFTTDELDSVLASTLSPSVVWLISHMVSADNIRKNKHSRIIYDALLFSMHMLKQQD
jgi:hypothetical protein